MSSMTHFSQSGRIKKKLRQAKGPKKPQTAHEAVFYKILFNGHYMDV